ncbi:MAG: type II secretion system protein, partial [Chthoniobacterales bacterium]
MSKYKFIISGKRGPVSWIKGFTLIEILVALAVAGVLSGTAIVAVNNVHESTRVSKLEADVVTINSAIGVYTLNGGTLTNTTSPQAILDQLKTSADATSTANLTGLKGAMVDRRLSTDMQADSEAAGSQTRAVWDATSQRFVITSSGAAGVKKFVFNDALASVNPGTETRTPTIKAGDNWVWKYADVAAKDPLNLITGSETGTGTGTPPTVTAPTAPTPLQLNPPTFSQPAGSQALINYDLSLTLSNPNPNGTSQIFYIDPAGSGDFSLYTGQTISVAVGQSVPAYAYTSDPDHWLTSSTQSNTYTATPVDLSVSVNIASSSLTYAQAGGAMTSGSPVTPTPATIVFNSTSQIPSKYFTPSKFPIYYTTDGTSPLTGGTAESPFSSSFSVAFTYANWGSASTLTISAAARSNDTTMFTASQAISASIGITSTFLSSPSIDPASGQKATDLPVSVLLATGQTYPVGARIYYTIDGTDPGNNGGEPIRGTQYTGTSFNSGAGVNNVVVVMARAYGPVGYGKWFTPSSPAVATYSIITLASGALVGGASLNGTFVGSLVYATPASGVMGNIAFNSGAQIIGNLYLPGTPTVKLSNGTIWSTANDSLFSSVIQGWEYNSSGVKTVQTTPRVIDETGSATPVYTLQFNNNALVQGKVIRRHTAPAFPTISAPPSPDSSGSTSLNSHPTTAISASQYSSVTLNSSAVGDVSLN